MRAIMLLHIFSANLVNLFASSRCFIAACEYYCRRRIFLLLLKCLRGFMDGRRNNIVSNSFVKEIDKMKIYRKVLCPR